VWQTLTTSLSLSLERASRDTYTLTLPVMASVFLVAAVHSWALFEELLSSRHQIKVTHLLVMVQADWINT